MGRFDLFRFFSFVLLMNAGRSCSVTREAVGVCLWSLEVEKRELDCLLRGIRVVCISG